jgi:hypothetical protein
MTPRYTTPRDETPRYTTPRYEETRLQPLVTDALIEERVAALVGRACQRQLWFLFLDEDQVQLPLLVPIDDPPTQPEENIGNLVRLVEEAMEATDAHSVVVVIERYAEAVLTANDRAWAGSIHNAFDAQAIPLRGILLSHRRGVRWVAQDDYRF